ncbi:MAG: hypothetical protein ACOYL5_17335 [Phototrophicaceae bacterium]|jgi:hypothetical protein
MISSLWMPRKVWIELHDGEQLSPSSCDVIVEMDDEMLYTAHFVTLAYLRRQMDLSYAVTQQMADIPPVRFATLETPHILVDEISREIIEDTLDNLIALDIFEGLFTQVTEDEVSNKLSDLRTPNKSATRATQEIAAMVLSDVLVVEGGD